MSPCGNIVLVGLSGAGKTSCAQILAGLLDMAVLDTDEVIQKQEGQSVATIFAHQGEAHFRQLERALIENLLEGKIEATVISVGGGLPAQGDNAQLLKQLGFTVFLDAPPETIARRLAEDLSRDHSLRPLLAGGNDCKEVKPAEEADQSNCENGGRGEDRPEKIAAEKSKKLQATLAAQLATRRKYYEEAHLVISTEGKSTKEICREIQTIIVNNGS